MSVEPGGKQTLLLKPLQLNIKSEANHHNKACVKR